MPPSKKAMKPPRKGTKRYKCTFLVGIEIDIADDLVEEVTKPEWKNDFYFFNDPWDVATHLAYNFLRNRAPLNQLDGFAHRKLKDAVIVDEYWDEDGCFVVVQPGKKTSPRRRK